MWQLHRHCNDSGGITKATGRSAVSPESSTSSYAPLYAHTNTSQPFNTLYTGRQSSINTGGGGTEQLRWDLVQIHCVNGDTLVVVQVQCRNGNRAQLERAGPPCSQDAPRTTEQNNTKLTVCTLQHMTVLQLTLCVYVCVCVVQLCVFPGPHVVTFMRRLTSFLLNCADCVNLKMGQPVVLTSAPNFNHNRFELFYHETYF